MPTTYNGIGTHYYGKKNRSVRTAACRSCHRVGALESYDTRLWFVVVFIPVVPLGRKRIIDKCPACTRHFAADAAKYEQARQLQTSGSMDQFRRDPSPQAALEAHASLLAFHEHDQAAEFRASALEKFPDHAGLRAGLGTQLDEVLEYDKAAALFQKALELDPDLPEARAGTALRRIQRGELDEARGLLDFLEAPGAGQLYPLGPLETLAHAYQSSGRHAEALDLAACLLRELPSVGQMHAFRSFVAKSERALGRPGSVLPRREHSLRGLFIKSGSPYAPWMRRAVFGGITALLLAAGLGLNNWYIRIHRTVHVVNATGEPVRVAVDGGPAAEFPDEGDLTVPEGHHRLRLTGAVDKTLDIDLNSDYFARWFSRPVWVLNPGGEAVFDRMTVYYAEQPPPSRHELIVGQPFIAVSHVDYAFEDPPESIQSEKGSGPVVKTVFRRVPLSADETFLELLAVDREAALGLAERRLRREPDNLSMLNHYVGNLVADDPARVEAYLKSGLDRRPVSVAWHRAYQTVVDVTRAGEGLVPQYDGYLAESPTDARLLYLRGRIDPDEARRQEFYHHAIEADPKLSWPWMALGASAGGRAEWSESIRYLRKALELGMDPGYVAEPLHIARLASGEAETLAQEYRNRLIAKPDDLDAVLFLCDALAASGQGDKVEPEIQNWMMRIPEPARLQVGPLIRPIGLYMAGQFEQAAEAAQGMGGSSVLAQSLLALGRSDEVADDKAFETLGKDPWSALAVGLGLEIGGREEDARLWQERAAEKLASGYDDLRSASKLLGATEPPPVANLERLALDPSAKALIFAVLARRFPDQRAEYNAEAARFNVRRKPPYELVRRAVAVPAPKAP